MCATPCTMAKMVRVSVRFIRSFSCTLKLHSNFDEISFTSFTVLKNFESKSNSREHQCHISWNDRYNHFRILTNGSYNGKCSAFIRKVRFDVRKLCYFNLVFIIFENLLFLNFMNLISDLKSSIFGVDFRFFWLTKKRLIESLWRLVWLMSVTFCPCPRTHRPVTGL